MSYTTLTVAQAAYIAGIVDGEGHLGARKQTIGIKTYVGPLLQVTQAKPEIINWLVDVLGCDGAVVEHRTRGHLNFRAWATMLRWLLPQIQPYLVLKTKQAELVLELAELTKPHGRTLTDEDWFKREALVNELHKLNERPAAARRRLAQEQQK